MILNRHTKVLTVLCVLAILVSVLSTGMIACAANYEPLVVPFEYQHVFITTDTNVDSVFHYIVSGKDGAALPAEADENGAFSFRGVAGNGEKDGDSTKFVQTGVLTFTFNKPGKYAYELMADLDQDNQKKDAERYTFEQRTTTVTFYIANAPDGGLMVKMITAEDSRDVKPNEVEFVTSYVGPATPPPTPTPTPVPTPTPTPVPAPTPTPRPATPKTGDDRNVILFASLMLLSGMVGTAAFLSARKQKGSEDDA